MKKEKAQEYCTSCKTIETHTVVVKTMSDGRLMRRGVCHNCGRPRALTQSYKFREENGLKQIDFYKSNAWRRLRFEVLLANHKQNGGRCALCKRDDQPLEVDHKEPRSKNPARELDETNLQVLCKDCNGGKSNKDNTDFRPMEPA